MSTRRLTALLFLVVPLALGSCLRWNPGAPPTGAAARFPRFRYAQETQGGCGNVFLYKGTADKCEVLWISADQKKLQLSDNASKTFDLTAAPDGLQVAVDLWETAPRFSAYCNDIAPDTKKLATWKATKGKLTITIRRRDDLAEPPPLKASAHLEGVVFEDGSGQKSTLPEETISDVLVGWYAG
jgi:hypothetical protein